MGARNRPNLVKQPVRSTAEPSTPAHQKSSFKVGNREEREGGREGEKSCKNSLCSKHSMLGNGNLALDIDCSEDRTEY